MTGTSSRGRPAVACTSDICRLGAPVGSGQPYLTIGSYPVQGAFRVTSELANQSGSIKVQTTDSRAIAFYDSAKPLSVFLAYPGSDVQVEVFSPVAHEAALLVSSGAIAPVPAAGGSSGTPAAAVSPAGLKSLAVQARHAVFWAGARPGVTYELTRGVDGRIFVRYLPPRVAVGSRRPYLTVGTYPVWPAPTRRPRLRAVEAAPSRCTSATAGSRSIDRADRPTCSSRSRAGTCRSRSTIRRRRGPRSRARRRDRAGRLRVPARGDAARLAGLSARSRRAVARVRPARRAGRAARDPGAAAHAARFRRHLAGRAVRTARRRADRPVRRTRSSSRSRSPGSVSRFRCARPSAT